MPHLPFKLSKLRKDKKISEFVSEVLADCNFDFLRSTLMKSILYGFSCAEIIYKMENGKIVIGAITRGDTESLRDFVKKAVKNI